jgi:hypothetical protein
MPLKVLCNVEDLPQICAENGYWASFMFIQRTAMRVKVSRVIEEKGNISPTEERSLSSGHQSDIVPRNFSDGYKY